MRTGIALLLVLAFIAAAPVLAQPPPAPPQLTPPPLAPLPKLEPVKEPITEQLQVQIQVWIGETGEQGLRDLGSNLLYTRVVRGEQTTASLQEIRTNVRNLRAPEFTVTLPVPDQTVFARPMRPDQTGTLNDGIQAQSGVGLTYTMVAGKDGTIDGVFRAVERKTDVDLMSKPELLVINKQAAEIHAGSRVPFQSIAYSPDGRLSQLKVDWQPIGVNLKLSPTILGDNTIQLAIETLEVSDIARIDNVRGIDLPVFSTRSQSGMVLVPNGQTLVIGGLSSRVIRKDERRVPIVGKLPLIGIPFRGRRSEATNSHLLIFVSPTVVDLRKIDQAATDALEFWRRGKWRHEKEISEEVKMLDSGL